METNAIELGALQFRLIFPDRLWCAADCTGAAQKWTERGGSPD